MLDPHSFNLIPVDSITTAPDQQGEVSWSSSGMITAFSWKPRRYPEALLAELLGEPQDLAPGTKGWAMAYKGAPDFGVMFVATGRDQVVPQLWDWGAVSLTRGFEVGREAYPQVSAWLNALGELCDQIAAGEVKHERAGN